MKILFDFYIKKHKFAIFSLGIEPDNKYQNTMKRLLILFAFCMILGTALSSCHRELCPAYSQADTEQVEDNV